MSFFSVFSLIICSVDFLLLFAYLLPLRTKSFSKFSSFLFKFFWAIFSLFSAILILFFIQSISTIFHERKRAKNHIINEFSKSQIDINIYISERNIFITFIGFIANLILFFIILETRYISHQNKAIQREIKQINSKNNVF